ncbi:hypothetical protein OI25_7405 [Paraburkholderia fungorum]|jgi:hypothetical protein|uniref:Uncharacterized protein n=1 Tax=Paraburkholderia fungorum TaxID=134537 RepID=A0AAP5UYQ9_9BURK|nr:hypothetical protein [Paraburkholderia fungorum]AJZ56946.1 hypothetical protein OI25_7405 [Paraburkholderia fungorum]EIF28053.1 hypothetical protein BCh11DRAFT_07948 [Burkholderia sp. Ch1-1]MDT8843341.1 hypothetical protein [Paraburkholderia fungorum]PRZ42111.1 hypothetical protein BX589_16016 [Paraburkholderia fungorum]
MTKKTIIVDEFHQGASAQAYRDGVQQMRDAVSDIHTKNDGIAAIRSDGIVLPTGHTVHVRRTGQPTKIYTIHGRDKFEDSAGNVYNQQEVFGETYDSVAVIDPATGDITTF